MNEDKLITIESENGEQVLAEVIFTFENEGDNFVFLTLEKEFEDIENLEEEYTVLVYKYIELEDGTIGELIEIEENETKTWELIDEVFATFQDTNFEME